jgi:hypothetical protein
LSRRLLVLVWRDFKLSLADGADLNPGGRTFFRSAIARGASIYAGVPPIPLARLVGIRIMEADQVDVRERKQEIWDLPIYEEMFRGIRNVNVSLPRERQLRVLLCDPPVEWESVRTLEDLSKWGQRDSHAADVVRREVLAKKRRALLVYGDDHLAKRSRAQGAGDEWPANLVGQLEQSGTRVFVVHTETRMDLTALQPDVRSWPTPSVARLEGTAMGGAEYEPSPRLRPRRMEELFDAVMYLGSPSRITFSRIDQTLCADSAYMQMRLARLALLPGPPPQAPPGTAGPLDRFKQACAGRPPRRPSAQ